MIKDSKQTQQFIGNRPNNPDRPPSDHYGTGRDAIVALIEHENIKNINGTNIILEPQCGSGNISKVLEEYNNNVISSDLYDYEYGQTGLDFLSDTYPHNDVDMVIQNPPFSLALDCVYKALEVTKKRSGVVYTLERLSWLEGIKRKSLFQSGYLEKVVIFSKRISRMHALNFIENGGKASTSMICFAWFKFSHKHKFREPYLEWF